MKKIFLIALVVLMVMCFVACTNGSEVTGTVVDKEIALGMTRSGYSYGKNAGYVVVATGKEYYLIVDNGKEKVRIKVKKKVYDSYRVGDQFEYRG